MKLAAFAAFLLILTAPMMAAAQDTQHFDVSASGYDSIDTLVSGDKWNEYSITVPKNNELSFTFQVRGEGNIMVYLIPVDNPTDIRYYTSRPVSEYSAKVPAVIGFDTEYTLFVNTSSAGDVEYWASIRIAEERHPEYMYYYALIVLGFVALVILSYKFVVWQEKREKEEKKARRRGGRKRGRK